VSRGRVGERVAYLRVAGWEGGSRRAVAALRELLRDEPDALIIDVRDNVGGDEALAQRLAGCFVVAPAVYGRALIRERGAWIGPVERVLEPTPGCSFPAARTAVLQGPAAASSNESFLLMMREAGAILVGETSAGSSGRPVRFRLGNGVKAWLPSWIDLAPDGTPIEGRGVTPDVQARSDADERIDAALQTAIAALPKTPSE
jgi:C-terminal processing protease CtpA/Prc